MYAVVQIGSRILRSAWGTKRSVPPFFCACTYGAAAAVLAIAAVPARDGRRLSGMGVLPCRRRARGWGQAPLRRASGRWAPLAPPLLGLGGQGGAGQAK